MDKMLKVYGIKNCDTVRKALKWLDENHINHEFQDFRKDPVSEENVKAWDEAVGRAKLVNKRGTTYRKLEGAEKEILEGETPYLALRENPTLMKRPIFDDGARILVGFTDAEKQALLEG